MSTQQLELTLAPLTTPDYEPEMSLADRFAAFHAANPMVADELERLAAEWLESHSKVGMKFIAEIARWRSGLSMPGEAWAINNSFVSFYARAILERRPEWRGRIELRQQKAAA